MQNLTLMDKDIPVCDFSIVEDTGRICTELSIRNEAWLPLSVRFAKDKTGSLQQWINRRSISVRREDLAELL